MYSIRAWPCWLPLDLVPTAVTDGALVRRKMDPSPVETCTLCASSHESFLSKCGVPVVLMTEPHLLLATGN